MNSMSTSGASASVFALLGWLVSTEATGCVPTADNVCYDHDDPVNARGRATAWLDASADGDFTLVDGNKVSEWRSKGDGPADDCATEWEPWGTAQGGWHSDRPELATCINGHQAVKFTHTAGFKHLFPSGSYSGATPHAGIQTNAVGSNDGYQDYQVLRSFDWQQSGQSKLADMGGLGETKIESMSFHLVVQAGSLPSIQWTDGTTPKSTVLGWEAGGSNGENTLSLGFLSDGTVKFRAGFFQETSAAGVMDTNPHLFTFVSGGDCGRQLWLDGKILFNAIDCRTGTWYNYLALGGLQATEFFEGCIGELMIISHPLTEEERLQNEKYLSLKWGLTGVDSQPNTGSVEAWSDDCSGGSTSTCPNDVSEIACESFDSTSDFTVANDGPSHVLITNTLPVNAAKLVVGNGPWDREEEIADQGASEGCIFSQAAPGDAPTTDEYPSDLAGLECSVAQDTACSVSASGSAHMKLRYTLAELVDNLDSQGRIAMYYHRIVRNPITGTGINLLWTAQNACKLYIDVEFECSGSSCVEVTTIVCASFAGIDATNNGKLKIECKVPPGFGIAETKNPAGTAPYQAATLTVSETAVPVLSTGVFFHGLTPAMNWANNAASWEFTSSQVLPDNTYVHGSVTVAGSVTIAADPASCHVPGRHISPLDMPGGGGRTEEADALACQARCASVAGCATFSWWPDGGCHIQDATATYDPTLYGYVVTTGPGVCMTGAWTEVQDIYVAKFNLSLATAQLASPLSMPVAVFFYSDATSTGLADLPGSAFPSSLATMPFLSKQTIEYGEIRSNVHGFVRVIAKVTAASHWFKDLRVSKVEKNSGASGAYEENAALLQSCYNGGTSSDVTDGNANILEASPTRTTDGNNYPLATIKCTNFIADSAEDSSPNVAAGDAVRLSLTWQLRKVASSSGKAQLLQDAPASDPADQSVEVQLTIQLGADTTTIQVGEDGAAASASNKTTTYVIIAVCVVAAAVIVAGVVVAFLCLRNRGAEVQVQQMASPAKYSVAAVYDVTAPKERIQDV